MKKRKNTQKILFGIFIFAILLVTIKFCYADSTNTCNLDVTMVNQDPYPATPGDYVTVVFQAKGGVQSSYCSIPDTVFELVQSYPFSLDSGGSYTKTLGGSTWNSDGKNEWIIPYKLRVDKGALDADYPIEIRYSSTGSSAGSYTSQKFNISVQDYRTMFDAVIQETSGSDVSIAIANTGKYTANSVVVRIPEQESFTASGTDGQMVGNLASGDYTIVGFTVSQKTSPKNMTRGAIPSSPENLDSKLKFDIYYTDNIGERRVANMELPLNIGNSSMTNGFNPNGIRKNGTSNNSSWIIWIVVIVIIISLFIIYRKYSERIKNFIKNKKELQHQIPSWISNAKKKEKSK